jgi:hypothetical protein
MLSGESKRLDAVSKVLRPIFEEIPAGVPQSSTDSIRPNRHQPIVNIGVGARPFLQSENLFPPLLAREKPLIETCGFLVNCERILGIRDCQSWHGSCQKMVELLGFVRL